MPAAVSIARGEVFGFLGRNGAVTVQLGDTV